MRRFRFFDAFATTGRRSITHHCCQNWWNSPPSRTVTQRKTCFIIRFENLKYCKYCKIWEICTLLEYFSTMAAKIGGIPHRAQLWLREKHVSQSDLNIRNIQLAISEKYTSRILLPKLGKFPTEYNSDSEKNMFQNRIWKSEIFTLQYLRDTIPQLGEFPILDNDSTVFLLVLGNWCTNAPMHQCTIAIHCIHNHHCTNTPIHQCTFHNAHSWEHLLHIRGGEATPACYCQYSNIQTLLPLPFCFSYVFGWSFQYLKICGCVASFTNLQIYVQTSFTIVPISNSISSFTAFGQKAGNNFHFSSTSPHLQIWNCEWLTHWLTHSLTGVTAKGCYRI